MYVVQLESDLTSEECRELYYYTNTYDRQYSPKHNYRQYECGRFVI